MLPKDWLKPILVSAGLEFTKCVLWETPTTKPKKKKM
jgi:hypothetical protein